MANEIIQTRISPELKQEAEALFASMGLGLSAAIRMFLQQCINEGGLPFQPHALGAMEEPKKARKPQKYSKKSS